MDIISQIIKSFYSFTENYFNINIRDLEGLNTSLNVSNVKQNFGDINSNIALLLSKRLNMAPKAIAQELAEKYALDQFAKSHIDSIKVEGPGFINIFLNLNVFKKVALEIFNQDENYFKDKQQDHLQKNYSVEFVSANPTGPLHIGNGRGGIIGDVLSNVLKFLSNKVTKEFYINDAGAQIEKLGQSLKIRVLNQLGQNIELDQEHYHGEYLIDLAQKCIQQYSLKTKYDVDNEELKDKNFFSDYARNSLLNNIQATLENYGIEYDVWFSETQLHKDKSIEKAIEKLKDYVYQKDGALWFKSSEFLDDKDRVIQKSTGQYTYVAADIAYLENKITRGANKIIMVLGQDHHSYVTRLKGLMSALGYNPDNLAVILYQLVTIKEDNQILRLSKRAGKVVTLEDVINLVGCDVARFFYLNKKADAHLDFDLNLALNQTEANPVYYIQYAYVRTCSIINKAQKEFNILQEDYQFISHSEKFLIKKIASLRDLLISIEKNYQVHLLTYYVLELAQLFHSYYSVNKVINKDNIELSKGRLFLITILNRTFYICFKLLGITTPEHM